MKRLVLFDIDGTLLDPDGTGRRAMIAAFERVFGTAGPVDRYSMAGKVDSQIVLELMTGAGFPQEAVRDHLPAYFETYFDELRRILDQHQIRPLPGVIELLERLTAHPEVAIGLLTGNIARAAQEKLRAAGLAQYFDSLGAYGDDALSRPELPVIAVQRAKQALGREFRGKEVVIVGDTPSDIECGRAAGAKTIAVATGPYSCQELEAHRPDFCFPDLCDTEAVIAAILQEPVPLKTTTRGVNLRGH